MIITCYKESKLYKFSIETFHCAVVKMERLEEDVKKSAKKSSRAARRLCQVMKSSVSKEKHMKAYESFCRAFGQMKAYASAYLIVGKLSAAEAMELRTDLRHAMAVYLKMRKHFEHHYRGTEKGIAKADKVTERKFIRTHREIMMDLAEQDPEELEDGKACEK